MKNIFIILFIFILSGTALSQKSNTVNIDSVTVKNPDLLIILDSLIPKLHNCELYETYNLVLIDIAPYSNDTFFVIITFDYMIDNTGLLQSSGYFVYKYYQSFIYMENDSLFDTLFKRGNSKQFLLDPDEIPCLVNDDSKPDFAYYLSGGRFYYTEECFFPCGTLQHTKE